MKRYKSVLRNLLIQLTLPSAGEDDVCDAVGISEQRTNFALGEAGDATTNLRDEECQFGMNLRKSDELIDIGRDGFYPTQHRRDAIALTLETNSLPPDGAKLAISISLSHQFS